MLCEIQSPGLMKRAVLSTAGSWTSPGHLWVLPDAKVGRASAWEKCQGSSRGQRDVRGDEIEHHRWLLVAFPCNSSRLCRALFQLCTEGTHSEVGRAHGALLRRAWGHACHIEAMDKCSLESALLPLPQVCVSRGRAPWTVSMQRFSGMIAGLGAGGTVAKGPGPAARSNWDLYSLAQVLAGCVTWKHRFSSKPPFLHLR